MEKITKEFNVYTIAELKELFPEAYEHAIEKEQDAWLDNGFHFECKDFMASLESIIENELECNIVDWELYLWGRTDISIGLAGYMNLSNDVKNSLISRFKAMMNGEPTVFDFTGVYTDDYLFKGLREYNDNTEELGYNNFHKAIESAALYAIGSFAEDMEKTYNDKAYHEDNLEANELLFTEDGTPYYK